jgi:N-acetyl-gamma-glutamyl-phosphate reductase
MPPQRQPVILVAGHDAVSRGVRDRLRNLPVTVREPDPVRANDVEASRSLMSDIDLLVVSGGGQRARDIGEMALGMGTGAPKLLDISGVYCGDPDWVYGFPELTPEHAGKIRRARRVAKPGSYATGAVALIRPLVDAGLLPPSYRVTINVVDGGIISNESSEDAGKRRGGTVVRLEESQVSEVMSFGGLTAPPVLVRLRNRSCPGILVTIPLQMELLSRPATGEEILAVLTEHYRGTALISVFRSASSETRVWDEIADTDAMELRGVFNEKLGHFALIAMMDSSGKAGAGVAVQNIALMLGLETVEESPLIESAREA